MGNSRHLLLKNTELFLFKILKIGKFYLFQIYAKIAINFYLINRQDAKYAKEGIGV